MIKINNQFFFIVKKDSLYSDVILYQFVNPINFHLYHYAGNNPVKYVDPDGRKIIDANYEIFQQSGNDYLNESSELIYDYGCTLTTYTRMAIALGASDISVDDANNIAKEAGCFAKDNIITPQDGAKLINAILKSVGITDVSVSYESSYENATAYSLTDAASSYLEHEESSNEYFVSARLWTNGKDPTDFFEHSVNVPSNAAVGDSCWKKANNLYIKDSSIVKRDQVLGCGSGRSNGLLRLDYFKINRTSNNE